MSDAQAERVAAIREVVAKATAKGQAIAIDPDALAFLLAALDAAECALHDAREERGPDFEAGRRAGIREALRGAADGLKELAARCRREDAVVDADSLEGVVAKIRQKVEEETAHA